MITTLLFLGANFTDKIDAAELKAYVEFLASDALAGRATPSKELDLAADYIYSSFKKSGLIASFQETAWERGEKKGSKVKNVIGVIRGSDPKLRDEYLIVSAHYDHLGISKDGEDKIFNGANDNASGVAGILESAQALADTKPKRSIMFVAFYGEEMGLVGSLYYAANPVIPLKSTVANINLEQIGRTDDSEAERVSAVSITGFDFTNMGADFAAIGKKIGVGASGHPKFSTPFFSASDNLSFALKGIPSLTICTAFEFKDYHAVGDSADKLDYKNMEKVVKFIALSAQQVANAPSRPQWNEKLPATKRYRDAANKLQAEG
jgi:Zn-dependent M28 family amino/carboxypeptidase